LQPIVDGRFVGKFIDEAAHDLPKPAMFLSANVAERRRGRVRRCQPLTPSLAASWWPRDPRPWQARPPFRVICVPCPR